MAPESVYSDRTVGAESSTTSGRSSDLPLSSYLDSLSSPAGLFQQSQPGLLGSLVYRNRHFTVELINAFSDRSKYTDLGETTAVVFENIRVVQAGGVSCWTFTSQSLADYPCVVVTGVMTSLIQTGSRRRSEMGDSVTSETTSDDGLTVAGDSSGGAASPDPTTAFLSSTPSGPSNLSSMLDPLESSNVDEDEDQSEMNFKVDDLSNGTHPVPSASALHTLSLQAPISSSPVIPMRQSSHVPLAPLSPVSESLTSATPATSSSTHQPPPPARHHKTTYLPMRRSKHSSASQRSSLPPAFVQTRKTRTPRVSPRPFLSTEDLSTNPYFKTHAEREAQIAHYDAFRKVDWAKGPLGPLDSWSESLKITVEWVLANPLPTLLIQGPSWTAIFNLSYARLMLGGSAEALGSDVRVTFADTMEGIASVLDEAIDGHVYHAGNRFLALAKNGKMMEHWMDLDYFPIREPNGTIGGFISTINDQTEQVINARRIKSLHELIVQVNESQTSTEVCTAASQAMCTNTRDVLSSYLYMVEETLPGLEMGGESEGGMAINLMANSGRPCAALEAKLSIPLRETEGQWRCLRTDIKKDRVLNEIDKVLRDRMPRLLANGFLKRKEDASSQPMIIIPLSRNDNDSGMVLMILEINPMLPYDQAYAEYIDTMGNALSARLGAIESEAERLKALQASAEAERLRNEELEQVVAQRVLEIRDAQLRFGAAFETSPAGLWILDPKGNALYSNQATTRMIGSLLGKDPNEWQYSIHPDDRERYMREWTEGIMGEIDTEVRVLHTASKPGSEPEDPDALASCWVHIRCGPTFDTDGNVVFISGSMQDIGDRRAREDLLIQRTSDAEMMQRRQEYFIDMISHELRNPLGVIDLTLDNVPYRLRELTSQTPDNESRLNEIVHDIDCLNIACAHMRRLIDDVLSLSKMDGELLQISPKLCQPVQCVREVLSTFRAEFAVEGIKCSLVLGKRYEELAVDHLVMDPARTQQVIINLISNAIKYTTSSKDPRITIQLDASLEQPSWGADDLSCPTLPEVVSDVDRKVYLIMSVTDTGAGMKKTELSRLFQRFSQVEPVFSIKAGGSGLGLFICKRLTRLMGGGICAASDEGSGSTFTFFIESRQRIRPDLDRAPRPGLVEPLRKVTITPQPEEVSKPTGEMPKYILVVEDNKINQRLVVKQLKRAGYIITTADDGVEALEQVMRSRYHLNDGVQLDCILMDVEMPNKDGLDCTRELRAMREDGTLKGWAPIIGVSANVRAGQVAKMMEAGMDGFVGKPFKIAEIIDKMGEMADRKVLPVWS